MSIFAAPIQASEALTANYECNADLGRQQGSVLPVDGVLQFKFQTAADRAALVDVLGFISINYDFNVGANGSDGVIANYTGVFKGTYENRANYSPRVYRNHFKFDDFDAVVTSGRDGGGMWGYLVVEKTNGVDRLKAHYIFRAGDHIGGTVDLSCRKNY